MEHSKNSLCLEQRLLIRFEEFPGLPEPGF